MSTIHQPFCTFWVMLPVCLIVRFKRCVMEEFNALVLIDRWVGGGGTAAKSFFLQSFQYCNQINASLHRPSSPGAEHINCDGLEVLTGGWGGGGSPLMHPGNHFAQERMIYATCIYPGSPLQLAAIKPNRYSSRSSLETTANQSFFTCTTIWAIWTVWAA